VSMLRLGVIADDLTGAMDTGLQFSKHGLETLVSMSWHRLPDAEVVVIDTDTRDVQPSVARERVLATARALSGRVIYKKVDSTMRGNVGIELCALQEALGSRCVVVAPAYPPGGRTTLRGRQMLYGKPLEQTFFARDPRWPMRESHLPTLLMQQTGEEVGHIGLEDVVLGTEALVSALRARPEPLLVVDALEQSHLRAIAEALVELGSAWLPCGSAGLAEEWVEALGLRGTVAASGPGKIAGPVLVVSASRNEVTLAQLRLAVGERGLARVDVDPWRCHELEEEAARLSRECLAEIEKGRDVILAASFSPLVPGASGLVTQALSGAAAQVARHQGLGGLFLTGGDVAIATCRRLGADGLRIVHEVQPGVPGGQLVGGQHDGMWVVTKAGGFGDERAVLDALAYLHGAGCGP